MDSESRLAAINLSTFPSDNLVSGRGGLVREPSGEAGAGGGERADGRRRERRRRRPGGAAGVPRVASLGGGAGGVAVCKVRVAGHRAGAAGHADALRPKLVGAARVPVCDCVAEVGVAALSDAIRVVVQPLQAHRPRGSGCNSPCRCAGICKILGLDGSTHSCGGIGVQGYGAHALDLDGGRWRRRGQVADAGDRGRGRRAVREGGFRGRRFVPWAAADHKLATANDVYALAVGGVGVHAAYSGVASRPDGAAHFRLNALGDAGGALQLYH
mmetsp:Transcript_10635/g.30026  ORF Transcript_10635/g.30026 Transcript_10635/m.30026 type:complete len:271 (-) Transcript_10635:135-947(-)